jgi:hypothetical protein
MKRQSSDLPPEEPRDAEAVVQWRQVELLQCGFPQALAERVAGDQRFDLHELIKLVEDGCSPALAVRILSPLEGSDELAQARE